MQHIGGFEMISSPYVPKTMETNTRCVYKRSLLRRLLSGHISDIEHDEEEVIFILNGNKILCSQEQYAALLLGGEADKEE